jgi:hypothetical protein
MQSIMNLPSTAAPTTAAVSERLIERFLPYPDHRLTLETLVHAPADRVFVLAWNVDVQSHWAVRGMFWLGEKLHLGTPHPPRRAQGLVAATTSRGWCILGYRPFRELVMGAVSQPWKADAGITGLPPEQFATYSGANRVKIAWTIEVEPVGPGLTRFRTETRLQATDEEARRRFGRCCRLFAIGLMVIRHSLLRRIRREAEQWYSRSRPPFGTRHLPASRPPRGIQNLPTSMPDPPDGR